MPSQIGAAFGVRVRATGMTAEHRAAEHRAAPPPLGRRRGSARRHRAAAARTNETRCLPARRRGSARAVCDPRTRLILVAKPGARRARVRLAGSYSPRLDALDPSWFEIPSCNSAIQTSNFSSRAHSRARSPAQGMSAKTWDSPVGFTGCPPNRSASYPAVTKAAKVEANVRLARPPRAKPRRARSPETPQGCRRYHRYRAGSSRCSCLREARASRVLPPKALPPRVAASDHQTTSCSRRRWSCVRRSDSASALARASCRGR